MLLAIIKSNESLESYNDLAPVPCKKWISFDLNWRFESFFEAWTVMLVEKQPVFYHNVK